MIEYFEGRMRVESTMEVVDDPSDPFPIGMRVLAVDDDPTCLFALEKLLRKCQYHVTVTTQAKVALKLLRENKNKFDLVISDVHMPDMDGFKLLELVGLEMDLPVIMLSINGDTKLVKKGISHGACDYLLKPVRMEELRNIWQHVFRRKKFDSKKNKINNSDKPTSYSGKELGSARRGNSDQNGKLPNKRKDHGEDEVDNQENPHNDEDSSTQKKPRVVWSVELHQKFIAAVNQLGIDRAVPKKILDLMNDESISRENVASHLQKYRLYLKQLSQAKQQANAVLGSANSSYSRMDFVSGNGHLQTSSSSEQFHNNAFRSFPPRGITSRLNNHASLSVHGFPSPGVLQSGISNNALMSEEHPQDTQGVSSSSVVSQPSKFPFSLLDQSRHCDNWSNAVQSCGIQTNSYQSSEYFRQTAIPPTGLTPSNSTLNRNMDFNFCDLLQMKHDDFAEDLVSSKKQDSMILDGDLNSGRYSGGAFM